MVCSSNNPSDTSNAEIIDDLTTKKTSKSEDLIQNATNIEENGEETHNNLILSFAGGSIAVLVFLIVGFAGVKVYKAKFSRRRNFNYTLSEDNGNIVGDENRVNC